MTSRLLLKVTCAAEAPERANQAFTVAAAACAAGAGVSLWLTGEAADGKLELRTAGVGYTETAKEVTAGHRLYGNVEGDLLYAYDMAAVGQELQPHLWARLKRA